jgi:DNA-binding MarR family transcriptional regulator
MAANTKSRLRGPGAAIASTGAASPAVPSSLEQQVFLDLVRLNWALVRDVEEILKPFDLSGSQFNVLRILRGAGPSGLACGEVGGRMITHDPDITRLLDRLENRGLISRARQEDDRRVVKTRITPEGLRILGELDAPLCAVHRRQFSAVPPAQLAELAKLLSDIRSKWETPDCPEHAVSDARADHAGSAEEDA